jgi:hypothetical protein
MNQEIEIKHLEASDLWKNLHSEELHNLYSSPDIIRQVKSRRMRWEHAWERREKRTRFWWESPKERDHSKDQGVNGRWDQNGSWGNWLGGWIGLD